MAISETSKAPSRTIGLKPLLVGEYSTKSNVTRSDLINPFFSAAVRGWSPSNVRSRLALFPLRRDFARRFLADHHNTVVVRDHRVAGMNIDPGANHGNVDGPECRLDRPLGRDRLRPHRKAHLAQRLHVAAAGVDDEAGDAARH